jgi:hypothetical protein
MGTINKISVFQDTSGNSARAVVDDSLTLLSNSQLHVLVSGTWTPVSADDAIPVEIKLVPEGGILVYGRVYQTRCVTNNTQTVGIVVSTIAVKLSPGLIECTFCSILNNGDGILYIGRNNSVTASGATMGEAVYPGGCAHTEVYEGEIWGIYSQTATEHNVSVWGQVAD